MDVVALKVLRLLIGLMVVIVIGILPQSAEASVIIHFLRAPPPQSRYSTATFIYSFESLDGSDACKENGCSISCQLNGLILPCHAHKLVLKNLTVNTGHTFILNITTHSAERNSSSYSWFIDTIPPTATITSEQNLTNAKMVPIVVTFSEPCKGNGEFRCLNSSTCDLVVKGPGYVSPSSLRIIKPGMTYSLDVILSSKFNSGRVLIRIADRRCEDQAGNQFIETNSSTLMIHFDRRPVQADFWTSIPSYVVVINGTPRTVVATNKITDMTIFLDFSIPIRNSTKQILNTLHVNSGSFVPLHVTHDEGRRYVFSLNNVLRTEIITVRLEPGSLMGRTGTPVSPVTPITFLYDNTKPSAVLRSSSPSVTKNRNVNIVAEFTKPVFGFNESMVQVLCGRLVRFQELSRALYALTVIAETHSVVSVIIPEGKVTDISGNANVESNQLEVYHLVKLFSDSTPAVSIALHSFVTAGTIVTSVAAAIVSISIANAGTIGTNSLGAINNAASDPSMNLNGMIGHLQVFVLTGWFSGHLPIEYSETIKGLRWLIPHLSVPWKKDVGSFRVDDSFLEEGKHASKHIGAPADQPHAGGASYCPYGVENVTNVSSIRREFPVPIHNIPLSGRLYEWNKIGTYGLPLSSNEYFIHFLRGEPMSANNVVKHMENHKGWQDLEMNLFWLGVGGGSLILLHIFIIFFLKWRTQFPINAMLSAPRVELFIMILILPCISQSATFALSGGTTGGIITGAVLLSIPASFIFSVFLFLIIAVFSGSFAIYKEVWYVDNAETWYQRFCSFSIGRPTTGQWFYREGLPSFFISRFGILFESLKGCPFIVFVDQNDPSTVPKWTESGHGGIARMGPVSSDESNEEIRIPMSRKVFGRVRSSYIILDLSRRAGLGIVAGIYSMETSNKVLFPLIFTLMQFIYLFTVKPYIRREVQIVEGVSLLCEVGVFALLLAGSGLHKDKTLSFAMLSLLLLTFIVQIINEWYALIKSIAGLSQQDKKSFKLGLKIAVKGLILPFLPEKFWSRGVPKPPQPKTGLTDPAATVCAETEMKERDRTMYIDPLGAMTATVVPVLSPGSPAGPSVVRETYNGNADKPLDVKKEEMCPKGLEGDQKSDMKRLRQLARASFSWEFKGDDEASSSYTSRAKP